MRSPWDLRTQACRNAWVRDRNPAWEEGSQGIRVVAIGVAHPGYPPGNGPGRVR